MRSGKAHRLQTGFLGSHLSSPSYDYCYLGKISLSFCASISSLKSGDNFSTYLEVLSLKFGEIVCLAFLTKLLEKSSEVMDLRTFWNLKMTHGYSDCICY